MESYRTNVSPTFDKDPDLVLWIGGQLYIEIWIRHFFNNPEILDYVGKLLEQLFNIGMLSDPGDKIIFTRPGP